MDGKKVYQIQINGISESISAVDALNKQLLALENRIKELEKSSVNVKSTSSNGNSSSLSEEEAIQKEINKLKAEGAALDAKIVAAQDEVYKKVDATKQLYKETVADQKALAAQERLTADAYSNTMQGMKTHLADLKAVINTTDMGDTEKIKQMTQEANELTNKLKEMEQAYGQFGRNVGNYANGVAEGLQKVRVVVGDDVREFDNAKQAAKTLGNELKTMAVNGQQGTEEFKNLQQAVAKLNSEIKDATVSSKAMDNLLDTMQSFAAIGTVSTGFASLFGIDDAQVEQSIKKMLAFQNVLKGIETINKQIQTREGIGAWIAPFTIQIDKATAKLLTFNTALLGTGTAAKVAAKGIKLASTALKGLASLGIVAVISIAIEKIMDLIESFNKLSDVEQAQKDAEEAMADAYGKGMAKLTQYKFKLDSFNGSKKEEKKLVEELNKEFGETLGTYKSVAEWQDVLKKKGDAYIQTLQLQAKAQAVVNSLTAAYAKLQQIDFSKASGEYDTFLNKMMNLVGLGNVYDKDKKETEDFISYLTKELQSLEGQIDQHNKSNQLGNYAPQIKKNTAKTKNALEESQKTLNQLEIRLMQEGLNKKLRQLDEEERQTINKLKENGRKSGEEIQKIQRAYAALRAKEINEYLKNLEESIKKSAKEIEKIQFEINTKEIDNQIEELQNKFDELSQKVPAVNTLITRTDIKSILGNVSKEDVMGAAIADAMGIDDALIEQEYKGALDILRSYGDDVIQAIVKRTDEEETILATSFANRLSEAERYYTFSLNRLKENIRKQGELNKKRIEDQTQAEGDAERDRYSIQMSGLTKTKKDIEEGLQAIVDKYGEKTKEGAIVVEESNKKISEETLQSYRDLETKLIEIDAQIETAKKQHKQKLEQITKAGNNAINKNEIDTENEIKSTQEKYYNEQLSNYRDFQSKLNDEISRNPVTSKGWGIVNIKETNKNYKEILDASRVAIESIKEDRANLERDFRNGLISDEAYNATKNNLNDLEKEIKNGMAVTEEASKNLVADFISSTQMYLQAAMDSFSTIMNAIWDAQDVAFDKEQEQIDKENDLLEEKLDEQQEIVQQHKSAIESIEDELATARGDRRQHLIDQINAEIEAQRRAQKEEQKIQKQKEAQQKKQDALDKKRKEAQYKRDMLQAVVNGAMAITMAAVNSWPIPAIPMMALAAATTAAQIAIMAANKPYAKGGQLDGGVAQGKRHSEGGIPVLGGRASIEGGEFITNRQTTAKNVDLLEYINAKHRKLNIDDFISFYSSGSVKKNITSMSPRAKFADGGVIPTLNNEYQFDDRLLSAFEDYANRPYVVSVVDINSRQEAVKNVQVLAGLGE